MTKPQAAGDWPPSPYHAVYVGTRPQPAATREHQIKTRNLALTLSALALATSSFVSSAANYTFTNSNPISIPQLGLGNPYPSTLNVSGTTGDINSVTVTLTNYSHTFSADVELLLVSPAGQKIILNNDTGAGNDYVAATITYSASASGPVSGNPVPSGTYLPAAMDPNQSLPTGAPAAPYSLDLTTLNGVSANGAWTLYVNDDLGGDSGSIGSWTLNITTEVATTCASEGYTGAKLTWCKNICENGLTGAVLDTWIHRWVSRYRDLPYCAVEQEEEQPQPE